MATQTTPVRGLGRGFWTVTLVLAVIAFIGAAYWVIFPISKAMPEAVTPADQIDALFTFMAACGTALFVFVAGYIIYFCIAFRARPTDGPDAIGVQVHDNHALELWWTVIPAVFVVILSVISVKIWYGVQVQENQGIQIESIGHQWFYTFRYPGVHGELTNEMHLPLGQPVTLHVTSSDVIHSFWVPDMRIKADMVPGLVNTLRFTPTRTGTFQIVCTEFCGTQHGEMNKQTVVIEEPAQFNAWLHSWQVKNANVSDELPKASTGTINLASGNPTSGQALFQAKCSSCHAIAPFEKRIVGPGLKGVLHDKAHPALVNGDQATPENVAKILQQGYKGDMGVMPNAQANQLSDKDISDLVAYLDSLK